MAEAFARHGTWVLRSVDAWDENSYVQSGRAKPGDFGQSLENIADVCSMFKEAGADHVKTSGAVVGNNAASLLYDDNFEVLNHYHDLDTWFYKTYTTCPFLQFLMVIFANQTFYTCQDKAYTEDGILGSISRQAFNDFWFSPESEKSLYGFNTSELLGHHCVSHAKGLAITDVLSLDPNHGTFV